MSLIEEYSKVEDSFLYLFVTCSFLDPFIECFWPIHYFLVYFCFWSGHSTVEKYISSLLVLRFIFLLKFHINNIFLLIALSLGCFSYFTVYIVSESEADGTQIQSLMFFYQI